LQATQARCQQRIRAEFNGKILAEVPIWREEPRGWEQLRAIGDLLAALDFIKPSRRRFCGLGTSESLVRRSL
jgi:hypothetical protein